MNKKPRGIIVVLFLVLSLCVVSSTYAGEGTAGDYMGEIGTKFGRGLWNVVTSPAEIPCTISLEMKEGASKGFLTGFGKGMAFMLRRILVGATEMITFVIPMERTIPPVCQ